MRAIDSWLVYLADPEAPPDHRPQGPLAETDVPALLDRAAAHGVLPAVARNLRALGMAIPPAAEALNRAVGLTMLLTGKLAEIEGILREQAVPALAIKGPAVAPRIYPDPTLRTFTDIDFLVPEASLADAGAALARRGFTQYVPDYGRRSERGEQKWVSPDMTGFLVELHSDLVGSPKLRRHVSLRYEDAVQDADETGMSAEMLLLIACIHGATSHQFDRLQHLVDILQVARGRAGDLDPGKLSDKAARAGALYAVTTGLMLAGRAFGAWECRELAARVNQSRFARLGNMLLSPAMVISAQSESRGFHSWRRKLYRELIVRGANTGEEHGRTPRSH